MPELKAFVIVQIVVNDWDGYRQYGSAGHQEIFDRFSGKVIGIDENVEIIEGSWPFTRTILIEFPSKELAPSRFGLRLALCCGSWRLLSQFGVAGSHR